MPNQIEFDCDFCGKRVVAARQNRRLLTSSVENKKCLPKYTTVKDVYSLFHRVNGTEEDPSVKVVCRKCSTLLESLATKFEEAKNAYQEKIAANLHPLVTDHTYFRVQSDEGISGIKINSLHIFFIAFHTPLLCMEVVSKVLLYGNSGLKD